ncbi:MULTISPECIES: hypothetical protein [unclassified Variovorax]|uniref:hypothetical protein n=1 Tax=unclassified Variovorax TaxID=663243 RepID=UPI00076D3B32|nr:MULTISPECIES: hypothetical protein [unclassified Variovorax]KWT78660.1 hypothetical protein APY03_5240 [Variovorax sp. WDL1]PNG52920.1 hypothetical protein CHC06_04260 [Variovorax sp. B2]PNG53492.1 hypothetical protein CHC07_03307 [Variovorax sp. B4]VTV10908.1 hypothetical protein WDL1CHR_01821 [Variovorax sp. WDL1]
MEFLTLAAVLLVAVYLLKTREQKKRILLLAGHLGRYQIETLMENLTEGYLRCLGENDPARREQIWKLLDTTEQTLAGQFQRFAADFARVSDADARVSTLPLALPFAQRLFPAYSFDMRRALAIHARGIADAAANSLQRTPRDKAYTMSAELFLMQHTCHWYCRSRAVASARMLARHKTPHAQLVDSVAPATRRDYRALVGG